MRIKDGIYIVPIYQDICSGGVEALWDVWVEDYGVYSAYYVQGTVTFTPELPPVVFGLLMGPINAMMGLMNPQQTMGEESSYVVFDTPPTGFSYPKN